MGTVILDASVVIGLLDAADGHHERAVDDVDTADGARHTVLIPASAYSEALVAFARENRITDARDAIAAMGIAITPMTAAIAETAAQLRSRHHRLRLPDAIVLATAHNLNAKLLSYDKQLTELGGHGSNAN
jgi:predicted nucleic acid-binding protein